MIWSKIKILLYVLLGLYFLITPFYCKVIKLRLPKSLEELPLIFCIISLILFLFLTLTYLKIMLKRETVSYVQDYLKKKVINRLQKIYYDSLLLIDNYIKHDLLGPRFIGLPLLSFTKILNKKVNEKVIIVFVIMFDLLPKILFLLILYIDVFVYGILNYIYLFSGFTLIPLAFRYIVFTLKEFLIANIKDLYNNYLCFVDKNFKEVTFDMLLENFTAHSLINKNLEITFIRNITLKNVETTPENFDKILDFYSEQLCYYTTLYNSVDFLEHVKKHFYYLLASFLMYFCYFILWTYIIFFNYLY